MAVSSLVMSPTSVQSLTKRARVYIRVSSEEQEKRFGLPRQRRSCLDLVEEMGFQFDGTIYEDAYSGTDLDKREGLQRMLHDAKAGLFDVLVLDEYNRLSRKLHHQGALITELERCHVEVFSVKEGAANGTSPAAIILRAVMGGIAEWERETFRQRVEEGRRERIASGKPTSTGRRPPYGLCWVDPEAHQKTRYQLKTDDEGNAFEAAVIRDIFQSVASRAYSIQQLANELTRRAIPIRDQRPGQPLKPWSTPMIRAIITNPIYMGKCFANRHRTVRSRNGKPTFRMRPREEWVEVISPDGQPIAPAIVDPNLWEAANEVLAYNRRTSKRHNQRPEATLLRGGHVFCAVCGRPMAVKNKYSGYSGPVYLHQPKNRAGCTFSCILARSIDDPVWLLIERILQNPEIIEERRKTMQVSDPHTETLRILEQRIKVVRAEQEQHTAALVYVATNPTAAEPIALKLKDLAREIEALEADRLQHQREQEAWTREQEHVLSLMELLRRVRGRMKSLSYEDKRTLIYALGVEVRIWPAAHGGDRWDIRLRLHPTEMERVRYTASDLTNNDHQILSEINCTQSVEAN